MNRKKAIDRISELLSRFRSEVETLNSQSLYDINIHAENVIIPILNKIYGFSLKNANLEEKNSSAIDLIDKENRIAIQVTSTANSDKIKHTLNQYKQLKNRDEFDVLLVYIITKKQRSYSQKIFDEIVDGDFEFSYKTNILDYENLLTEVNTWIALPKINNVVELLEQEFTEEKLGQRKYRLENKDQVITEILYPNLLEIKVPDKVYIGVIGINRDDVITKSWETEYKLKKSAPEISVVNKAFDIYNIKYSRDWYVFEKKIISFKRLDDKSEPLSSLIEIGTVEEYSINDFVETGYKYEQALSRLIDKTIQELTHKKGIQWLRKDKLYRFRPPATIRERRIKWKNKKTATRTVVKDVLNKEKTRISHIQHLSFKIQSFLSEHTWYVSITPTWSYTFDGYRNHNIESKLITQKKKLETNNSVYQHFMFISFCLNNKLSENEEDYNVISFKEPFKLSLSYKSEYGN